MPEPRNVMLFLADIVEAASDIMAFVRGMDFDGFMADRKTRLAVIRGLEVIGEAVKNLPEDLKGKYPDVDWRAAVGMRDKLIHAYFGTSDRIIWDTVNDDLPGLERQIKDIIEDIRKVSV